MIWIYNPINYLYTRYLPGQSSREIEFVPTIPMVCHGCPMVSYCYLGGTTGSMFGVRKSWETTMRLCQKTQAVAVSRGTSDLCRPHSVPWVRAWDGMMGWCDLTQALTTGRVMMMKWSPSGSLALESDFTWWFHNQGTCLIWPITSITKLRLFPQFPRDFRRATAIPAFCTWYVQQLHQLVVMEIQWETQTASRKLEISGWVDWQLLIWKRSSFWTQVKPLLHPLLGSRAPGAPGAPVRHSENPNMAGRWNEFTSTLDE